MIEEPMNLDKTVKFKKSVSRTTKHLNTKDNPRNENPGNIAKSSKNLLTNSLPNKSSRKSAATGRSNRLFMKKKSAVQKNVKTFTFLFTPPFMNNIVHVKPSLVPKPAGSRKN